MNMSEFDRENMHECFVKTASSSFKPRLVHLGAGRLKLMHVRKRDSLQVTINFETDLGRAHVTKQALTTLKDLGCNPSEPSDAKK